MATNISGTYKVLSFLLKNGFTCSNYSTKIQSSEIRRSSVFCLMFTASPPRAPTLPPPPPPPFCTSGLGVELSKENPPSLSSSGTELKTKLDQYLF